MRWDVLAADKTMLVLSGFAEGRTQLTSVEIWQRTRMPVGTLYPILLQLEAAGWLTSQWMNKRFSLPGESRLRLYRITDAGKQGYELMKSKPLASCRN